MEKLEDVLNAKCLAITAELLPGIEKFLRTTLAKESLSPLAEKQRQYYVERLDVIQLPPHLPPKPDGGEKTQMQGRKLPEPVRNKSAEDFIAHQRAISRQARSGLDMQSGTCEDNPVPNNGLGIDSDQYDEGLYEEPVPMDSNVPEVPSLPTGPTATFEIESGGESSTSYESYDEPDGDEPYNNIGYDGLVKSDIPLPKLKTKRKKKAVSINDRYYKQLQSIIHEGELYHRGKIAFTSAWTKRFCAICDGIFYCYKDKDSKPIFSIPLLGYDVILQEREKGRSNVLRLSHPGCETHFISTDSASETQAWMNKIEALCFAPCTDIQEDSKSTKSTDRTGSMSSMEMYSEGPGSAVANGSPGVKNRKITGTLSSDGKREKKGKIGKFLSETFGKKKGRAAAQHLEIVEGSLQDRTSLVSPDITIAGVVRLSSTSLLNEDNWQYKNCAIRNGVFECYKDDSTSSDLDFSLQLSDYELSAPDKNSLSLAVTKQGETAFVIEPANKLDQGDWLSALLKHVGNGGVPAGECPDIDDLTYTYVDSRSLGSVPSDTIEVNSMRLSLNDLSEDERQYADLSDKQSDLDSSDGEGDTYDEPPVEVGDRQSKMYLQGETGSLIKLFAGDSCNNVYEEVPETASPTSSHPASQPTSGSTPAEQADKHEDINRNKEEVKESNSQPEMSEVISQQTIEKDGRQPTEDTSKADSLSSPNLSAESNRPAFSRESSSSSEGSSRRLSEAIAKNRAMFENNSANSNGTTNKWSGYKLAGATSNTASPIKRTPSLSSTASSRSNPNSAASSPKNARANLIGSGNVDRFKAAFEAREANNNTIIDKQLSPSIQPKADANKGTKKVAGSISPIRMTPEREESTPPPKFTSIFNVQTAASNNKPKRLEIKSVTPSPYTANGGSVAENLPVDPSIRTLQRFTAEETGSGRLSANSSSSYKTSEEDEEQAKLDALRKKISSLRKERQKVRDQKLSTVLPEDIERLNCEYKAIDAEYKSTNKQIEILEDRKLRRIKDPKLESIERRRLEAERNTMTGKKKLWEGGS